MTSDRGSEPIIRAATVADIAGMSALLVASWHRTYDPIMGPDEVDRVCATLHNRDNLASELENTGTRTFVALEEDCSIVGVAKIDLKAHDALYLDRLHVDPSQMGTGLATRLLIATINAAPPAQRIRLEVLEGNERAIRFYERLGFFVEERLDRCGAVLGVPTLVMTAKLPFRAI